MNKVEEIRTTLAECFTATGDASMASVASATLYGWRTESDGEPDVDVLIILDGLPTDYRTLRNLTGCFDANLPLAVNVTWMLLDTAQADLRTLGNPLTEIAQSGIHVTGTPIAELVSDAAPYDALEVSLHAHEMSRSWAARIRHRSDARRTGDYLALVIEGSANVALMHHRMGRVAPDNGVPSNRGVKRLARLIGDDDAGRVAELIVELRSQGDADCSRSVEEVQRLTEVILEVASDTNAPGCTIG